MNRFLTAKHWQIFILQTGIPLLLHIIMMVTVIGTAFAHRFDHEPPREMFTAMMIFFPVIMVIGLGSLLGWQWSVGMGLQRLIPAQARMKTGLFKACIIVPVIFFAVMIVMMLSTLGGVMNDPDNFRPDPIFFFLMIFMVPLYLFTLFAVFHNMVFVAKAIKTAEMQREVVFGEYAVDFILNWFLFVGIWFLQPRINKLVSQHKEQL